MDGAWRTIERLQAMRALRKGQVRWVVKGDTVAQRQFIHTIFGIATKVRASTHAFHMRFRHLHQNRLLTRENSRRRHCWKRSAMPFSNFFEASHLLLSPEGINHGIH